MTAGDVYCLAIAMMRVTPSAAVAVKYRNNYGCVSESGAGAMDLRIALFKHPGATSETWRMEAMWQTEL